MRWDRLFADLEAELLAAEAAERSVEIAERTRAEAAGVRLVDRFRAAAGTAAVVDVRLAGGETLRGRVADTGQDWVLLAGGPGADALLRVPAVLAVTGLAPRSGTPAGEVAERFGMGAVLRGIARDRATVRVLAVDGATRTGTVDRVGADHLDLAEHPVDEPRRPASVRRTATLPFAAIAAVLVPPG